MKKILEHREDFFRYLSEQKLKSNIWYLIRNHLDIWYIQAFTHDTIGVDILIEYVTKFEKIEPPKDFFRNIVNSIIFSDISEQEQEKIRQIAKKAFQDGLLYFEKPYILEVGDIQFLNKLIDKNILIEDEGKLRFQNILLLTYLAAPEVGKEEFKDIDDIFIKWLNNSDDEYFENYTKMLYIIYITDEEKFNTKYLKPRVDVFLNKIDATDDLSIAQSMINAYDINIDFKNGYPTVMAEYEENDNFLNFLGIDVISAVVGNNYSNYENTFRLRYLDENGHIQIDFTKLKEDKFIEKILNEEGTIDLLVEGYRYLEEVSKNIIKEPSKDYCDDWKIEMFREIINFPQ